MWLILVSTCYELPGTIIQHVIGLHLPCTDARRCYQSFGEQLNYNRVRDAS